MEERLVMSYLHFDMMPTQLISQVIIMIFSIDDINLVCIVL